METQLRGTDWRSILSLVFSLGGIALIVIVILGTLVLAAVNEVVPAEIPGPGTSPLATALLIGPLLAVGALLVPLAWLSIQRLRGKEFNTFALSPLRPWAWFVILGLWITAMLIAAVFYDAPGAAWYIPLFHFLSIGLPIYVIIRVGVNRIPFGSSQRAWSVFSSGMIVSPIMATIGEGVFIIFGLLILGIYMAVNPDSAFEIQQLATQLESATDLESVVYLLGPLLKNPLTILTALTFLSVLVPFIEEIAKSIGVWLVVDRLTSPAQGFALGFLSGAGFALAESLFGTIAPDESWALTLSVRAFSGVMHMMASGFVGWGIAYARLEKRWFRLIGLTFLSMFLHGAWNAGAVLTTAGGARTMLAMPDVDIFGGLMALGGIGMLLVLMITILIALFVFNHKLRTPSQPPPFPLEMREESHGQQDGGGRVK